MSRLNLRNRCIFLQVALATVLLTAARAPTARAYDATDLTMPTSCQAVATVSYTGTLSVPADTYTIYAHLSQRGQTAQVAAYAQSLSDNRCKSIGHAVASGDTWTPVGQVAIGADDTYIFQLSSSQLGESIDANRPSLMLVSSTHPACVPTTNCTVTVDGRQGIVLPSGTLNSQDSLHVVRAIDPSTTDIRRVTYYVDDRPVYSRTSPAPFDLRYVSDPHQLVEESIEYASGERVVLPVTIPADHLDSPFALLFRWFETSPRLFIILSIVLGLVIASSLALATVRFVHKRHLWRMEHDLTLNPGNPVGAQDHDHVLRISRLKAIVSRVTLGLAVLAGVVISVVSINTYVLTLFRVDGHSMESTYHDGARLVVNKIPVTWARLAGRDYVPKRGQVIIVKPVYGIVDPAIEQNTSDYIVKRVFGLPGDRVVIENGVLAVHTATGSTIYPDQGSPWQRTMHPNDPDENIDVTLSTNELFVSGDNRPESIDSRFNGPIATDNVIGVVVPHL